MVGEEVDVQNITSLKSAEVISNNESMLKKKDEDKVEKKVNNVEVDVAKGVLEEVERLVNDVVEDKVDDIVKETVEEKVDETVDERMESNVKDKVEMILKNRVNKIVGKKLKDILPSILSGINEVSDSVTGGIKPGPLQELSGVAGEVEGSMEWRGEQAQVVLGGGGPPLLARSAPRYQKCRKAQFFNFQVPLLLGI